MPQSLTNQPTDVYSDADGGGVRGLSSLLILQTLMRNINVAIEHQRRGEETRNTVEPRDVFDLVAGTSTGGLIAIMLGKLGMTLEESIQAYHDLSKNIFGKKHLRGRITMGLARSRYSGTHLKRQIQGLIQRKGFKGAIPMVSGDNSGEIGCAVICREHIHPSKYSDIVPGTVLICNFGCHKQVTCLVSEAARATSAAPTYFPVQKIGDRYFVDGGMEFNNPSYALYNHYEESDSLATSKRTSIMHEAALSTNRHDGPDLSRVRFVNLGTGTKSSVLPPRQRDRLAKLVPGFVKMTLFLKRTLTDFAVNSEITAGVMVSIARASTGNVNYERFSADNGVCYIKLDRYKELRVIEDLTLKYLETPATQARLQRVGEEIAIDYLSRRGSKTVIEPVPLTSLTVPDLNVPSSQATLSQTPEISEHRTSATASTNVSCEIPDDGTRNDPDRLEQARSSNVIREWETWLDTDTRKTPAETMTQISGTMTNVHDTD